MAANMYVTDSKVRPCCPRADRKREKSAVRTKWVVDPEQTHSICLNGNISVVFDKCDPAQAILTPEFRSDITDSYIQISSALMLYRTISFFECGLNPHNVDFYKCNWQVVVTHAATDLAFALGEWKGGFQIFTPFHDSSQMPSAYKTDVEELLTLLVSPDFTIGYDGTVAGSVA